MANISAVISAYNEEKKIEDCLKSLVWVDEIIVVDNSSSDKTVEIAKKYTTKIIKRENNLMLNVNKNFGFTKAEGEWILNLDADERVSKELQEEIKEALKGENAMDGYWIPRKNIIFGKWIENSIWWPDRHLRLFKKGKGKFAEKYVHEHIEVKGNVGMLLHPIIHENYSSISQFIRKMDSIYTESEVANFIEAGKKIGYLDAIRFPAEDFLKTFFYQKGYKDGLHGLVLSMLQAFYSFIVFAKIWEKQGFKEENPKNFLSEIYKESEKTGYKFHYWFLSSFIDQKQHPLRRIYYKILRKSVNRKI